MRPTLGRALKGDERALIISDALWRGVFNGAPDALGRVVKIDDEWYTVAGVMPRDFRQEVVGDPDVFVPLPVSGQNRESKSLGVIGRLKPGVTTGEAAAEMHTVAAQLAREYPQANGNWTVKVENLRLAFTKFSQGTLRQFLGFGGFVLLIACANVAALLLARFAARQKEFALVMALGANRRALLRHALAESAWIAFPGAAGGVGVRDPASFAAAVGTVLLLAAVAGMVPARRAARVDPLTALRQD